MKAGKLKNRKSIRASQPETLKGHLNLKYHFTLSEVAGEIRYQHQSNTCMYKSFNCFRYRFLLGGGYTYSFLNNDQKTLKIAFFFRICLQAKEGNLSQKIAQIINMQLKLRIKRR